VITDGTGGLPRHMLTAVLSQFPELDQRPVFHPFCRSEARIRSVVESLPPSALVFSAVASPQLKEAVADLCKKFKTPIFDLTGGCVDFVQQHTGFDAVNDVARVHTPSSEYLDRIDAWEFSLQHDDSRRLESIHEAQIVLAGLSRVSKTPVSAYLGWLGFRVANVSLAPETPVPKELKKTRQRSVGLTMRPRRLVEIRARRLEVNGFAQALEDRDESHTYSEMRSVIREVMFAEQQFRKLKIPMIDTTTLTVEETAARVLDALDLH
jgi:regulator of PEP synthase PpsR (kinase-PPPase family)